MSDEIYIHTLFIDINIILFIIENLYLSGSCDFFFYQFSYILSITM